MPGRRVIDRDANLECSARAQHGDTHLVRKHERVSEPPIVGRFRVAREQALFEDAELVPLEIDLHVVPQERLDMGDVPVRVRAALPLQLLQAILEEHAVQILGVSRVHRVLHALQPVAWDHGGAHVAHHVIHGVQIPFRQEWRGPGPR